MCFKLDAQMSVRNIRCNNDDLLGRALRSSPDSGDSPDHVATWKEGVFLFHAKLSSEEKKISV